MCLLSIPLRVYFIEFAFSLLVFNSKPGLVSAGLTRGFLTGPVNQRECLSDWRLLMEKPLISGDDSFSIFFNLTSGLHWHYVLFLKLLDIPLSLIWGSIAIHINVGWCSGVLDVAVLLSMIHIHTAFHPPPKLAYKPWYDKNESFYLFPLCLQCTNGYSV